MNHRRYWYRFRVWLARCIAPPQQPGFMMGAWFQMNAEAWHRYLSPWGITTPAEEPWHHVVVAAKPSGIEFHIDGQMTITREFLPAVSIGSCRVSQAFLAKLEYIDEDVTRIAAALYVGKP